MKNGYALRDTFNNRTISRHRTLRAAHEAEGGFHSAFHKANSPNSYIPTAIVRIVGGTFARLTEEEMEDLFHLENER